MSQILPQARCLPRVGEEDVERCNFGRHAPEPLAGRKIQIYGRSAPEPRSAKRGRQGYGAEQVLRTVLADGWESIHEVELLFLIEFKHPS